MAGGAKRRRTKFLGDHPVCCFCGGHTATTTEDHVPPKTFFFGRQWPSGYSFPACTECNNGSAQDDYIAAFVTFTFVGHQPDPAQSTETRKRVDEFWSRYPDEARAMIPSRDAKKDLVARLGYTLLDAASIDRLPVVSVTDRHREALDRVLTKLAKALHYKHCKRIVPKDGGVDVSWWTNVNFAANEIPEEVLQFDGLVPPMFRDHQPLRDQFEYSFSATPDGLFSVAKVRFKQSIIALLLVSCAGPIPESEGYEEEAHSAPL